MKTQCTYLEGMTGIIRMTFIGLISHQIHGFKLKTQLASLLPQDIAHLARLLMKACIYLEVTMDQNSLMTFTATILKRMSGFKFISNVSEIHHQETVIFF